MEVTRFQKASTELTVTEKALPAVCELGEPVFPLEDPGAAASPGRSNCILANVPALIVMVALVLGVMLPLVVLETVAD